MNTSQKCNINILQEEGKEVDYKISYSKINQHRNTQLLSSDPTKKRLYTEVSNHRKVSISPSGISSSSLSSSYEHNKNSSDFSADVQSSNSDDNNSTERNHRGFDSSNDGENKCKKQRLVKIIDNMMVTKLSSTKKCLPTNKMMLIGRTQK